MSCDQVDDDAVDRVFFERSADSILLNHLLECPYCSERYVEYHETLRSLRKVLREAEIDGTLICQ